MPQSKVVFLLTSPETVIADYSRLMRLASIGESLPKGNPSIIGIDLTWHHFFPGCSSTPWQIDGVLGALIDNGYPRGNLIPLVRKQPAVSVKFGEILNRQRMAVERHGLVISHPEREGAAAVRTSSAYGTVLEEAFPGGLCLPVQLPGAGIVLLPTMKTHADLIFAGSLYTLFGVMHGPGRLRAERRFHESIVETFAAAKEMSCGMTAVMDATFVGEGPGPRRLVPHVRNVIAASNDPLALDAVAARMMGFDPLAIPYIRAAHDAGLGTGDIEAIEVVGDNLPDPEFGFNAAAGKLDRFLRRLELSPNIPLGKRLSMMYDDWYWMIRVGEKRMKPVMKTAWGHLFEEYRK